MKRSLFTILFCSVFGVALSQQQGDYRTDQNGPWIQVTTWEVFVNGAWVKLESVAAGSFRRVIPSDDSGTITIRHTVNLSSNVTINQLVVAANGVVSLGNGLSLIIEDDGVNTPLQIDVDGRIVSNGTVDLRDATVPVEIFGILNSSNIVLTTNPAMLLFHAGSRYLHQNKSGGSIPLATWDVDSNCEITGMAASSPTKPSNLNQLFGNFKWNTPNMTGTSFSLGGALQNVVNDLTIISTGTGTLRFGYTGPGINLNVGGDLIVEGGSTVFVQNATTPSSITINGDLDISGGTLTMAHTNGPTDLFLKGNFVKTGGTLVRGAGSGTATIRFDGSAVQTYSNNANINSAIHFSVQSGSTLDLGTSFLSGAGSFSLLSGGTLAVGSLDPAGAIQLGNTAGNIRTSGARLYQAGSTIVYNGLGTQFMGNGHPANPNTTVDNNDTVYMTANAIINGALTLENGSLVILNNTLTLGGTISYPNGFLGITSLSNLVINGTGNFGNLVLAPVESQSPPNPMRNLTINRTGGGIVTLGLDLIVAGTYTQTAGTFMLDETSGSVFTLRGPVVQTAGNIGAVGNPALIIDGTGALPANLAFVPGTTFEFFTMNRPGVTFSTTSALSIANTFNLWGGIVNHPTSNITMGPNALLVRRSGASINQLLSAATVYNVIYEAATNMTSGNELPVAANRLRDLYKQGIGTVTLDRDVVVNGSLFIEEGTLDVGTGNDLTLRDDMTVSGIFEPQQGLVILNGSSSQTISGTAPVDFFDLRVNQTAASTVDLLTNVNIENNLSFVSSSTLNAGTDLLRLLSTPTRTANVNALPAGASIIGRVIVDRYLAKAVATRNYHYLSSPVINSNIPDWDAELPISAVYRYNEATRNYVAYSKQGVATPGVGYAVYVNSDATFTVDSRGTLAQGNISVPVTARTAEVSGPDGYNLVGNPYPSAIDWDNIVRPAQIYNAMYMTDNFNNSGLGPGVQQVSYVDGVASPVGYTGQIAQGQAFFIKATGNTNLVFTEAAKITNTNAQFIREAQPGNILRITLNGAEGNDETVIRIREGATKGFDSQYDAEKFFMNKLNLSTITSDNVKAVINALGQADCSMPVPLMIEGANAGTYHFNFSGVESFDAELTITLIDVMGGKTINLKEQKEYAFDVSQEALGALATRFQISIGGGAILDRGVKVAGDKLCDGQAMAILNVDSPQSGVVYRAEWNGYRISDPVTSTGLSLQIAINTERLLMGENEISVIVESGLCSQAVLTQKPIVTKLARGKITSVQDGYICNGSGVATLIADGAGTEGGYNWYESENSLTPIDEVHNATFTTPLLSKSKTYYVTAVNGDGCEGSRVPVNAVVTTMEPVVLSSVENRLISSYEAGNQWYFNGHLLEETSSELETREAGVYEVRITHGGCSTTASLELAGSEESFVTVFPNPTQDKVFVRINSKSAFAKAVLISLSGTEIESRDMTGEGNEKETVFDLRLQAGGIYHIRISDGSRMITTKVAKIE